MWLHFTPYLQGEVQITEKELSIKNFKLVWKIQTGLKKFKPKIKFEPQHSPVAIVSAEQMSNPVEVSSGCLCL